MNGNQGIVVDQTTGEVTTRETFAGRELATTGQTAAAAMREQARAQIEAMYTMAMHRPRSWDDVRTKLLHECKRTGFAESAIYHRKQGRKQDDSGNLVDNFVTGLSIRFAEAALRTSGNMLARSLTTYDDDEKRIIAVQVIDLETNATQETSVTVAKRVEKSRIYKGQVYISARKNSAGEDVYLVASTDDELRMAENNQISRAKRNLILSLLPGDIREEAFELAKTTRASAIKADPDKARKDLIDAFAKQGIQPSELEAYMARPLAQLSPAEIETLRGIYVAVKENEVRWADLVAEKDKKPEEQTATKAATKIAERVKQKSASKAEPPKGDPPPPATSAAQPSPKSDADSVRAKRLEEHRKAIEAARSDDELIGILDTVGEDVKKGVLTPEDRNALTPAAAAAEKRLGIS